MYAKRKTCWYLVACGEVNFIFIHITSSNSFYLLGIYEVSALFAGEHLPQPSYNITAVSTPFNRISVIFTNVLSVFVLYMCEWDRLLYLGTPHHSIHLSTIELYKDTTFWLMLVRYLTGQPLLLNFPFFSATGERFHRVKVAT